MSIESRKQTSYLEIEEQRTRKAYLAIPDSESEADDWSGAEAYQSQTSLSHALD